GVNSPAASCRCGAWTMRCSSASFVLAGQDRAPAVFAKLHQQRTPRFALPTVSKASSNPLQGFASPAKAALDPGRYLPEDDLYEGEALLRITRYRDSLLSLWSNWKAHDQGLRGP